MPESPAYPRPRMRAVEDVSSRVVHVTVEGELPTLCGAILSTELGATRRRKIVDADCLACHPLWVKRCHGR